MTLPRLFDHARPRTRARFAEVLASFEAGERLAHQRPLPLPSVRAAGPYAFEGVGLRLALRDRETLRLLFPRIDAPERVLLAIGVGWAVDRRRPRPLDPPVPPMHRADRLDGQGFHRALFHAYALRSPKRCRADDVRDDADFDRGVGRGLYFAAGGRPDRIDTRIRGFPTDRHEALWTGVGVALAFTGGLAPEDVASLEVRGGPALATGVARGARLADAIHGAPPCRHP